MSDTGHTSQSARWLDRRFAPAYALVIAFAVAWAVGGLLNEPTETTIRFVQGVEGVDGKGKPAAGLAEHRVEIYPALPEPLRATIGTGARLTIPTQNHDFLVCVDLRGRARPAGDLPTRGDYACWSGKAAARKVEIRLPEGGSGG